MIKAALRRMRKRNSVLPQIVTFICMVLGLLVFALPAIGETKLNGLGEYNEFGKTTLLLKLELGVLSDSSSEAISQDTEKVLSFRLLEDRTARSWAQLWIQNLSINNAASSLNGHAETLVAMTQLLPSTLKQADLIQFQRISSDVTRVYLNNVQLAEFQATGFFDFLLTAFIGSTPPSSVLKAELLASGEFDSVNLALFDSLNYTESRKSETIRWEAVVNPENTDNSSDVSAEAELENVQSSPEIAVAPSQDEDVTLAEPIAAETVTETITETGVEISNAELNANIIESTESEDELALNTDELGNTTISSTPLGNEELLEAPLSSDGIEVSNEIATLDTLVSAELLKANAENALIDNLELTQPIETATNFEPETEPEISADNGVALITQESILAIQRYQQQAVSAVYKQLKYPESALRRNRQGEMRVAITVGRDGTLYDTNLIQTAEYDEFNQAALDAFEAAEPFPVLPDIIEAPLRVEIPVKFQLQ